MAIGNPSQVGSNSSNASGQTSIAASGCVIPANSLVVVVVGNGNATTDPGDPTSVVDNAGTPNNYAKDVSNWTSNAGRISIWSFYDSAGATRTITANFASSNEVWLYVFTISGAASSAFLDKTGTSVTASGTDLAVTTSAAVTQADEVAIGAYARTKTDAATTWPGTGYTSLVNVTDATRGRGFMVEYKNGLTNGAAETSPGTLATAQGITRCIATYKGAAGGSTVTFASSPAGAATVTADDVRTLALAALAAGVASVSNDDVRTLALAAVVNGTATVIADEVAANRVFAAAASGQASIVATLDSPAGGITVVALARDQFAVIHHHHGY